MMIHLVIPTMICLAPASTQMAANNGAEAASAVRAGISSFLTLKSALRDCIPADNVHGRPVCTCCEFVGKPIFETPGPPLSPDIRR
jgi:hypothetical protein